MRKRLGAIGLLASASLALGADGRAADPHAPPPAAIAADVPMLEHAPAVASYTLRAKLDPAEHMVHGEGTIHWTNASREPVSELWLHLYLNAFKNQSSVFMRAPIGGFRGSAIPRAWGTIDVRSLVWRDGDERHELGAKIESGRKLGPDDDETDARVPLPRPIAAGESVDLDVVWDDKLPSIVERTGFAGSFHMIGQWFPKIAKLEEDGHFAHFPFHHLGEFYSDFGAYDVTLDVPAGFVVGATGMVTESKDEGGRHVERHVQADVHDFAWTAWDKFVTRKETIDGVAVTVLVPPGYDDHAERELATLRFALPYYGARYGKYPYPVLTVVHPPASAPEAGGMEYPTLITTGEPSFVPRGIRLVELVTIHEFGHQYFYGLCASNEDRWPFLDEGVNSYAEGDALRSWLGPGSAIDLLGLQIDDVVAQAERARHFVHDQAVAESAGAFATGIAYGSLVYGRTAAILETLARVYGKDRMTRALAVYARRWRFRHPGPDDLVAAVREGVGADAADNLRAALFDKGWVDYAITQIGSRAVRRSAGIFDRDGKRETVTAEEAHDGARYTGSVLVARRGTLKLPVEIELVGEDGTRTRTSWNGDGELSRIPYAGASPLRAAVIDPDTRILLDDQPENDFATTRGEPSAGAPRIFERATFWTQALLGGLGP